MESAGYPNEYNINDVNNELKDTCFYKWGKGKTRCYNEICNEHIKDKYGLRATKKDKNTAIEVNKLRKNIYKEILQDIKERVMYEEYLAEKAPNITLSIILEDFKKNELLDIARKKGIGGVSQCNKKPLINRMIDFMLEPEIIKSYFWHLSDEEINAFERVIEGKGLYKAGDEEWGMHLFETSYILECFLTK